MSFPKVHKYIDYVLSHQAEDGWLGVDKDRSGTMYWGRYPMLLALLQVQYRLPYTCNCQSRINDGLVLRSQRHRYTRHSRCHEVSTWSTSSDVSSPAGPLVRYLSDWRTTIVVACVSSIWYILRSGPNLATRIFFLLFTGWLITVTQEKSSSSGILQS